MTDSDGGFDRDDRGTAPADGSPDGDATEAPDPALFDPDAATPKPVEPGSPTLENAAFVLLGVASMIALVFHLISLL